MLWTGRHLESYPPGINMYTHVWTMYVRSSDNAIVRTMLRHLCTYHEMYIPSGLLANYYIVVFDYDISIYWYRLQCCCSMKMTMISCITRYRVIHDISNYNIVFHAIVYYTISCFTISCKTQWHETRYSVIHYGVKHNIVYYTMA